MGRSPPGGESVAAGVSFMAQSPRTVFWRCCQPPATRQQRLVIKIKAHRLSFPLFFPLSRLPDGLTRRGDINLLMLGDPGTAKSQLLKFVEKCSPIGVGGLRCSLVARLVSSFCSLRSTEDQTVVQQIPACASTARLAGRGVNCHFWCEPGRDGAQGRGRGREGEAGNAFHYDTSQAICRRPKT